MPTLFNQPAAILPAAGIALDKASDRQVLAELIHQLPKAKVIAPVEQHAAKISPVLVNEAVAAKQAALKHDVEKFYLYVVEQSQAVSANQYLEKQQLDWDSEIWLYQVIADYQALPNNLQKMLRLRNNEEQASDYNHLRLIKDVELQLR